jgi:hypothetical protein
MALSQIADLIVPHEFAAYSMEQSVKTNRFIASGILTNDARLDAFAAKGGLTESLPFLKRPQATSVVGSDDPSVDINPNKVSADKDIAVKHLRNIAFSDADIVQEVAGVSPLRAAINLDAEIWNEEYCRLLLKTLDGVFGAASMSGLVNNLAIADGNAATAGNKISLNAVLDTMSVHGDRWDGFSTIAMHSDVYRALAKQNVIEFVPQSEQKIVVPTFAGMRVVYDDSMPKVAGGTSGFSYGVYLFKAGAAVLGQAAVDKPVSLLEQPLAGNGSGVTTVVSRRKLVLHVPGVKFTSAQVSATTPTDADIALGTNWARVVDVKNVGVAKLIVNG